MPGDLRVRLGKDPRGGWEGKTDSDHNFDRQDGVPKESAFHVWELNELSYLVELILPGGDASKDYILLAKVWQSGTDRFGRRQFFGTANVRLRYRIPQGTKFNLFFNDRSNSFDLYIGSR